MSANALQVKFTKESHKRPADCETCRRVDVNENAPGACPFISRAHQWRRDGGCWMWEAKSMITPDGWL